ncbi:MAG: Uncharacterised protein [Bacteroidota bacterium]|nr:MAG: Uncharacterised protein [Bacteroidota bacterium]
MKNNILFFAIILLSLNCYAQVTYEKGYFINNANQKIHCLIKNVDWRNNPTAFEYKLSENDTSQIANIKTVKEFGVTHFSKYVRRTVNIDRSSVDINELSKKRAPIFYEEELFLKVLIEGKASLLQYIDKRLTRYFYESDTHAIEQLVFKEYKTKENKIASNNEYRQQLYTQLNCDDISMSNLKSLKYEKKALIKFFTIYNNCNNTTFVNFDQKTAFNTFNLNIRPGFNSSSLGIENNVTTSRNRNYDTELTFRFGLECEFILGFNKNKWAVIIEPTYQYYKAADKAVTNLINTDVDYSSIELPIGVRHYLFLNDNSKVFINGLFNYDVVLNDSVRNFDAASSLNFAMGVGYNFNKRYGVEFRYHTSRDVLNDYLSWSSDYKTISVIFGYTLF